MWPDVQVEVFQGSWMGQYIHRLTGVWVSSTIAIDMAIDSCKVLFYKIKLKKKQKKTRGILTYEGNRRGKEQRLRRHGYTLILRIFPEPAPPLSSASQRSDIWWRPNRLSSPPRLFSFIDGRQRVHCKKRFATFPSSAWVSLTKLSLGRSNLIIPAQGEFGKWHPGWGRECR